MRVRLHLYRICDFWGEIVAARFEFRLGARGFEDFKLVVARALRVTLYGRALGSSRLGTTTCPCWRASSRRRSTPSSSTPRRSALIAPRTCFVRSSQMIATSARWPIC